MTAAERYIQARRNGARQSGIEERRLELQAKGYVIMDLVADMKNRYRDLLSVPNTRYITVTVNNCRNYTNPSKLLGLDRPVFILYDITRPKAVAAKLEELNISASNGDSAGKRLFSRWLHGYGLCLDVEYKLLEERYGKKLIYSKEEISEILLPKWSRDSKMKREEEKNSEMGEKGAELKEKGFVVLHTSSNISARYAPLLNLPHTAYVPVNKTDGKKGRINVAGLLGMSKRFAIIYDTKRTEAAVSWLEGIRNMGGDTSQQGTDLFNRWLKKNGLVREDRGHMLRKTQSSP